MLLEWIFSLLTLTAMEIVLGIDNIVFITILVSRLPPGEQDKARRLGLGVALASRLLLLLGLFWVLNHLTAPLFYLTSLGVPQQSLQNDEKLNEISWHDLILIAGGLFLIGKSVFEIHGTLEGGHEPHVTSRRGRFAWTLVQVAILDIVFSLDSVITAVGMSREIWIMVTAMILAVGVMLGFAGPVGRFVQRHPTLKMLALSFLILIGVLLVAEGIEKHINRGYIYFAMIFALGVELLNLRVRKKERERAA